MCSVSGAMCSVSGRKCSVFRRLCSTVGSEVFSPRRGGIQFGDRWNSDRQAPGRHARGGPSRCLRAPSRPDSSGNDARVRDSRCPRRAPPVRHDAGHHSLLAPSNAGSGVVDSNAECFGLRWLEHACPAVSGPDFQAGAGGRWQGVGGYGANQRQQGGAAAQRQLLAAPLRHGSS